jgi:hypothetical protein
MRRHLFVEIENLRWNIQGKMNRVDKTTKLTHLQACKWSQIDVFRILIAICTVV